MPIAPQIPQDHAVYQYMLPKHVEAFQRAAAHFKVWILVRRGNPASLQWVGKVGYIPKPRDCKAKTAERNVGTVQCAGLVVSPKLLPGAFDARKLKSALDEWPKFEPLLYKFGPGDPRGNLAADRSGKHYTLQTDPAHKHYGCVLYKPVFRELAEYIHADYDLYAVAPQSDPKSNIYVRDPNPVKQEHSRSKYFYDVQYFVKAAGVLQGQEFGSPMIRHGEQDTFKTDWDDTLDVFWPDGKRMSELVGADKIKEFYRTTLEGRVPVSQATAPQVFGKWIKS